MDDWLTLFGSYLNSGVHCAGPGVDEVAVQEAAVASGLDFTRIDVRGVSDKAGFLTAVASALEFPPYFGMNWDALHDCLTDMSWRPAAGYVLLFSGLQCLAQHSDVDVEMVPGVLDAAAAYWKQRDVAFYVVLAE